MPRGYFVQSLPAPKGLSHNNPVNYGCFWTPAKAGVQKQPNSLDSRVRGNDGNASREISRAWLDVLFS